MVIEIKPVMILGLRYFELYIAGVFLGLYTRRDEARMAARRYDWSAKKLTA